MDTLAEESEQEDRDEAAPSVGIGAMPLIGGVSSALAQEVPASAVSCHFVARAYLNLQGQSPNPPLTATVAGYITDIPGIGDPQKGQDSLCRAYFGAL